MRVKLLHSSFGLLRSSGGFRYFLYLLGNFIPSTLWDFLQKWCNCLWFYLFCEENSRVLEWWICMKRFTNLTKQDGCISGRRTELKKRNLHLIIFSHKNSNTFIFNKLWQGPAVFYFANAHKCFSLSQWFKMSHIWGSHLMGHMWDSAKLITSLSIISITEIFPPAFIIYMLPA